MSTDFASLLDVQVYVYKPGMELPKTGSYYVVAGNGIFYHKENQGGITYGMIPVKDIPVLANIEHGARVGVRLPKISEQHVHQIKEFFRRVVKEHNSEANTILFYHPETKEYKIHVPEQEVTHGGVDYKREAFFENEESGLAGYLRVGTIHSHCNFDAFHSSTDVGDEDDFDGVHVTFGHNDKDEFSISCSIVVNGFRAKVDPERYLEGLVPVTNFVTDLEEKLKEEEEKKKNKTFTFYNANKNKAQKVRLTEVDEEIQEEWFAHIDDDWMSKVTKKTYQYQQGGWGVGSWDADGYGYYGVQGGYGVSGSNYGGSQGYYYTPKHYNENETIYAADKVRWRRNEHTKLFRELCGDNMFHVMSTVPASQSIIINTKLGKGTFKSDLFQKCYYANPSAPAVVRTNNNQSKKKHVTNGQNKSPGNNGNAVAARKRPVFQPDAPTPGSSKKSKKSKKKGKKQR